MRWYAVLGEDMKQEELCKLGGCDGVMSRDENGLLGQSVNHNENGSEAG